MITKNESEILSLLKEHITIRKISYARKISIRTTQRIVKKLKEKGLISGSSLRGFVFVSTTLSAQNVSLIRLHGQEFNLRIKFKGDTFEPKKTFIFDGNTIRVYTDSIEVYSHKSFYGNSTFEVKLKSKEYFNPFFNKLQGKLDIYIKEIREANVGHYSDCNNELANEYNTKKKRLNLKAKEDDKPWLTIDHSLKIDELETIHPQTAEKDMDRAIKPFFDSLRDMPFTANDFHKICYIVKDLANIQANSFENTKEYGEAIKNHMRAITDIREAIKQLTIAVKSIK
jgi:hypothetical protein